MADRPPKKIGRAQSDREIQPLDERGVQFRGVLGVAQRLFESPRVADHGSSLDLDDAIVFTGFDHLAIQTCWPQNAADNSLVDSNPSVTISGRRSRFIRLATS